MPAPLTLAWVGTFAASASFMAMRTKNDMVTRTLSAAVAMVFWGLWSFQNKAVVLMGDTEPAYSENPGLFYAGLLLALVMGIVFARMALQTLTEET